MTAPESKVAAPVGGPFLREGSFIYSLHDHRLPSGKVVTVNRIYASVTAGAGVPREEADAAAQLFAAAPELLEALMQAQSLFQQINRDDGDEFKNLSCDGLDLLEPLIARATGAAS